MSAVNPVRNRFGAAAFLAAMMLSYTAEATIVRFQTSLGDIDVRLYDAATPLHVANILSYIDNDRYDGTFIHRSAKHQNGEDFVIQGGGYQILTSLLDTPLESGWTRIPNFGTVTNEPGISNLRGTLALAKSTGVSSGTSEWFINLNDDNAFLDQPPPASNLFTVFGRVVGNGMMVADAIAALDRVDARVQTQTRLYNGAFNEVPVLDVHKVIAQQDVLNDDVVRLINALVLDFPAGDYDFDGTVNANDYRIWRSSFGSSTLASADGNGNGVVDAADYVVWRNTFGQSSGGEAVAIGPAAVPEPATILMLAFAAGCLATTRRWRSDSAGNLSL